MAPEAWIDQTVKGKKQAFFLRSVCQSLRSHKEGKEAYVIHGGSQSDFLDRVRCLSRNPPGLTTRKWQRFLTFQWPDRYVNLVHGM
jgi:hypothetical protein